MSRRRCKSLPSLLLLGGVCACGPEAAGPLRLELPVEPSDRSVVIAVEAEGRLTLHAAEVSGGESLPLVRPLRGREVVRVTALLYETPLDALGLAPGPLAFVEDGAAGQALPAPNRLRRATVKASVPEAWTALAELPRPLDELRIPALDPCPALAPHYVALGAAAPPTFALALDDTWALVGTEGPEVFFVDGAQAIRQSVPIPLFAGYRRDDGQLWLGGEGGAVFSATFAADPSPRLDLTRTGTTGRRERILHLVGAPDGEVEHFALTSDLDPVDALCSFEWFDGATWRLAAGRRRDPHDATWVTRGFGLFASFFRGGEVLGARDGAETSILVDALQVGSVVQIEQVPGFGLVAGSTGGELYLDGGDGRWIYLGGRTIQAIADVHGYRDGIVFLQDTSITAFADGALCDAVGLFDEARTGTPHLDVVGEAIVFPLAPREGLEVTEQRVAWFAPQ